MYAIRSYYEANGHNDRFRQGQDDPEQHVPLRRAVDPGRLLQLIRNALEKTAHDQAVIGTDRGGEVNRRQVVRQPHPGNHQVHGYDAHVKEIGQKDEQVV